jgi:hypothetical protein
MVKPKRDLGTNTDTHRHAGLRLHLRPAARAVESSHAHSHIYPPLHTGTLNLAPTAQLPTRQRFSLPPSLTFRPSDPRIPISPFPTHPRESRGQLKTAQRRCSRLGSRRRKSIRRGGWLMMSVQWTERTRGYLEIVSF